MLNSNQFTFDSSTYTNTNFDFTKIWTGDTPLYPNQVYINKDITVHWANNIQDVSIDQVQLFDNSTQTCIGLKGGTKQFKNIDPDHGRLFFKYLFNYI